jgi:hypothetical protein
MNQYIWHLLNLVNAIYRAILERNCRSRSVFSERDAARTKRRQVFDQRKSPQPTSPQRQSGSFNEAAKKAADKSESEQVPVPVAQNRRNEYKQPNSRRKSKRARWAEEKEKQDSIYAEAKNNGDNERIREYWKWTQKYGASTKEYFARAKARRKAAKKIADKNDQITSAKAKQRRSEIKADAQCELPEDLMIEHLEDHRDGIGWSIAALAKKRFYVRRTLKPNDPNGDMFCEVDDNGASLLKAVKQLISDHNHSNKNK